MKVQIVNLKYSMTNAAVEVKTPVGAIVQVGLPTNKVLTRKELVSAIQDQFNRLEEMGKRVQVVKDLMFQEIEVKGKEV